MPAWLLRKMGLSGRFHCYFPDGDGAGGGGGGGGGGDGDGGSGDGDGDGDGGSGGGGGGDGGSAGGGSGGRGLTQSQVDSIVAKRLADKDKQHKSEMQKQLAQNEELLKAKNLTEEQRAALEQRSRELEDALMTEKERTQKEKDKLTKQHATEKKQLSEDRDSWRQRCEDQAISTQIATAASVHGAVNPSQLMALIRPMAALVEEKDEKLNPTGQYIVRVEAMVASQDKDGKEVFEKKQLSVDDYVKYMLSRKEHSNLFRSTRVGGSGHRPGTGGSTPANADQMTSRQKIAAGLNQQRS